MLIKVHFVWGAMALHIKNVLLSTPLQPYKTIKIALNTYNYIFILLNTIIIIIICFNIPYFQLLSFRVDNVRRISGYFFYRKLYNGGNCSTI